MKILNCKKSLIILFSCSLIFKASCFELQKYQKIPKHLTSIRSLVSKVERKILVKRMREFIKEGRPSRLVGSPGHKKALMYLIDIIKSFPGSEKNLLIVDSFIPDIEFGKKTYQDEFNKEIKGKFTESDPIYKKWDFFVKQMVSLLSNSTKITGKNLIWEKQGNIQPDEVILLTANYDTISFDNSTLKLKLDAEMPGADNNASSVIVLLSLIELLSHIDIPKTVRIVFLDFEEIGTLGSHAYIKKYQSDMKKKGFAGLVNLVMLGNDTEINDKTKKFGNMKVYIRNKTDNGHVLDKKLATLLTKAGEKINSSVRFPIVDNSFQSSGHTNFWNNGIPSVVFTQDWENDVNEARNHTPNDFIETLNFRTLYNSFQFISGSVIAWAFDVRP